MEDRKRKRTHNLQEPVTPLSPPSSPPSPYSPPPHPSPPAPPSPLSPSSPVSPPSQKRARVEKGESEEENAIETIEWVSEDDDELGEDGDESEEEESVANAVAVAVVPVRASRAAKVRGTLFDVCVIKKEDCLGVLEVNQFRNEKRYNLFKLVGGLVWTREWSGVYHVDASSSFSNPMIHRIIFSLLLFGRFKLEMSQEYGDTKNPERTKPLLAHIQDRVAEYDIPPLVAVYDKPNPFNRREVFTISVTGERNAPGFGLYYRTDDFTTDSTNAIGGRTVVHDFGMKYN
jgi:hypothetical protein